MTTKEATFEKYYEALKRHEENHKILSEFSKLYNIKEGEKTSNDFNVQLQKIFDLILESFDSSKAELTEAENLKNSFS